MPYSNVKTGDIAARPRQALDDAGADRIGDIDEDDRDGSGRLLQRRHVVAPDARMMSGASATSSSAYARIRCASPATQR